MATHGDQGGRPRIEPVLASACTRLWSWAPWPNVDGHAARRIGCGGAHSGDRLWARHVHPSVADQMDYASVVGGCIGASTPAGARLAGLSPTGTMPHALVLIFGDTVRAAQAFDRHIDPDVPRIVLVDTFKDEAEESLRVAEALGERLWGVRLDTPSERGRVTPDLG